MSYLGILLQASGSSFQGTAQILLMVGMFAVMYFLMLRPQQKKQKAQRKFTEEMRKGDDVVTMSGMHGKITEMDDKIVTLEVAPRVKITFDRSSISYEATKALKGEEKK